MDWSNLVAVTVTVVVLFVGSRLTSGREHRAWLREKRLQAYTQLFDAAWAAKNAIHKDVPVRNQARDEMLKAVLAANLLSPDWLNTIIWDFDDATSAVLKADANKDQQGEWAGKHRELSQLIRERFGYNQDIRSLRDIARTLINSGRKK